MAAVYPFQYKQFTAHRDLIDDVDASDVNNLQYEVAAIQQTLGLIPASDTGLKMKINTWASVGARLDAIQRGTGIPVVFLSKPTDSVKASKNIIWPRPSTALDPESLYNGSSITTNRSGWWIITAGISWADEYGANAEGTYRNANIRVGSVDVQSQDSPPVGEGATHTHVAYQGYVPAGQTINLNVYDSLNTTLLPLGPSHLAAALLREM